MAKIGLIRCEKNINRCPMTNCIRSLAEKQQSFSIYDECELIGIFSCNCPGDNIVDKAKILKARGADAIHFSTCIFATKGKDGWTIKDGGFCDHIDDLIEKVHNETGLTCVKGSAHLPSDYTLQVWK